jgi:hypothetical protein
MYIESNIAQQIYKPRACQPRLSEEIFSKEVVIF